MVELTGWVMSQAMNIYFIVSGPEYDYGIIKFLLLSFDTCINITHSDMFLLTWLSTFLPLGVYYATHIPHEEQ